MSMRTHAAYDRILAFECVGQGYSIALSHQQEVLATDQADGFSAKHQLIASIKDLANEHGTPHALACAIGPGSFTGLRVASVCARSMAWAWSIPVFCINTLEALAIAHGPGSYLCLMPLKRDTTFYAAYEITEQDVHCLLPVQAQLDAQKPMIPHKEHWQLIGPALEAKPELINNWDLGGLTKGTSAAITATDVLAACQYNTAQTWQSVLPAYFQASAPEIQREQSL